MIALRDIFYSFGAALCGAAIVLSSTQVLAQVRSSSNYQLESDSINVGGGLGNSANFGLESTVGEVATGRSTSTNFSLQAGYQQLDDVFISLQMNAALELFSRIELAIQSSEVDSTLTDFPVYVNLADLGPEFWSNVTSDGRDIRITTADGVTETPFEIVSIDNVAETGELHFKAPTISSSVDTSFYIKFGNDGLSAYSADDTYGSENVWTNNYVYVSHDGGATDSTANGNDGATVGTLTSFGGSTNAQMGVSTHFDGSGYINLGNASELELGFTFSLQTWVRPVSTPVFSALIATDDFLRSGGSGRYYGALVNLADTREIAGNVGDGGNASSNNRRSRTTTTSIPLNQWSHVAVNFSSLTGRSIFFDGVSQPGVNSGSGSTMTFSASPAYLGDDFNGLLDEVRFSSVTRTTDWYESEFTNQDSSTTFYATSSATEVFDGFALTPALPGLTGGTSNGSTTFTVITDSPTGYEATIQASDAPAMQNTTGSSISNYNNGNTADFAFTIPAASAVFGFSPEGVDVADAFLDNTSVCGTGSSNTPGACWAGVSTTPVTIAESTSSNQPDGAATTLQFQVGISSGGAVESGVYTATTTLTALPL